MYIVSIDRGFVVMTELFGYAVEAVFVSEVVDIQFNGLSITVPVPREILLYDRGSFGDWIENQVVLMKMNARMNSAFFVNLMS